ncbi:HAMP domain-containing sensor histidine kinase [Kineosporia sp. R_H_3]|uniref:sensor histidine kinase n=1 Tax=Kineosporia sp. R_H_3 TaxID=1961848 RepID=UPI000B4B60DB
MTRGDRTGRPGPGLAARLISAQLLVICTAVVTAWVVAAAVGPRIFHGHLNRISHADSPAQAQFHAEQAFRDASLISTAVALIAALSVAMAVSSYVTRRISSPVSALAAAAQEVAGGHYDVRVPRPALGVEFQTLARSFTSMAERLQSVEVTRRRLLADLAHEMRTPVATLDAYLEAIEDGVANLDVATSAVLRAQTRRLARLAEDVTSVSRAEEHQLDLYLTLVWPGNLVAAAVNAAAERYAAAGVTLSHVVAPQSPEVHVDIDRMGQVLGNLLDNALRHTPAGGQVQVRVSTDLGKVRIEVADSGVGLSPEHLAHVFERFYRVDQARDRAHGGSGIGLAIVKAVVEAHGGRVAVSSDGPGRGAVFTVVLPAVARSVQRGAS